MGVSKKVSRDEETKIRWRMTMSSYQERKKPDKGSEKNLTYFINDILTSSKQKACCCLLESMNETCILWHCGEGRFYVATCRFPGNQRIDPFQK